jgi:hypothetical protein
MTKAVRLIRLLASFPSDVADEAAALDGVAAELNRTVGDHNGIRFEVLNWLRDVRPGVGLDVQDVINKQVEGAYDGIVATFWSRAGTPTPRAASGSIEEVKTAVLKAKTSGPLPYVLIYMKAGGVDLLKTDAEQVRALEDLRKWLSDQGVLYKPFQDRSSYEALLRLDLAKIASEIERTVTHEAPSVSSDAIIDADDELGFLDYLDIQESAFNRMKELMDAQASLTARLTSSIEEETAQATILNSGTPNRSEIRRLLRRTSDAWNAYAAESEVKLLELQRVTNEGFDAMARALSLDASTSDESKGNLINNLTTSINASKQAAVTTREFRDSTAAFPRMTSENNRAKRRVVDVLDGWTAYFEKNASLASEILETLATR